MMQGRKTNEQDKKGHKTTKKWMKNTNIKVARALSGRPANLHLTEGKSDCSKEHFALPHLLAEAPDVESNPIIHADVVEPYEMFPVSIPHHNSTILLQRDAP